MNAYKYKARNSVGEMTEGTLEAESEQSAASLLTAKQLFPVHIKVENTESIGGMFNNKVKTKDKVMFIRQFSTMIKAGLPITQALASLREQSSSQGVKNMIEQVTRDVEAGSTLSNSFAKFEKVFSNTDVHIVAAGEASGKLDEVLVNMADESEKNYKIVKKIKTVFIYPAFLASVVVGIVSIMMVFVLPQMKTLYESFDNATLPLPTLILIGISNFLTRFWWLVIILFVAGFVSLKMYIKKNKNGMYMWHRVLISMPLVGPFLKLSYMAIFTRTMSSLVSSGVPILDALEIISETMPNVIYRDAIMVARDKVKQGSPLSEPLSDDNLFPPMIGQMVGVGEQTGEIDVMFKNLADYFSDELENWVKSFQSILEPFIIVIMGVIIGGVIISIILPIYNIANIVR